MAQNPPKYPHMASCANPIIQGYLRKKYGTKNLCWAIVWLKEDDIAFYTFELNKNCDTNSLKGNRPTGSTNNYFVSYIDNPRLISQHTVLLVPSINKDYECSYDYITKSGQEDYVTVDIDYVWENNIEWRALELTTWYKPFFDRNEAERLISMMNRRPSWNSIYGATALLKQIEAAKNLGIEKYIMACVNVKKGVSNDIIEDGNAYWFELTAIQVSRLSKCQKALQSRD